MRETVHGPIITDPLTLKAIDQPVALKWTALQPNDTTVQSMINIGYSTNWRQFVDALRDYVVPSQHIVYADKHNNIGYYAPGLIPIRKGWSGKLPIMPGEHKEWSGYIPFEKLPHVFNPPEGFISSANNRIASSAYPYSITYRWKNPGYRSMRITTLLGQLNQATMGDMKRIQMDTVSYLWKNTKSVFLKTVPLNDRSDKALALLNAWDGNSTVDSVATTIFNEWYSLVESRLTPEPLHKVMFGDPLFVIQQLSDDGIYCQKIAKAKNCADLLERSLDDALTALELRMGLSMSGWHWGKVHKAEFSMLALGKVKSLAWIWSRHRATPGDAYTVNVGTYNKKTLAQTYGASIRQIIDFSDLDKSAYVLPLGQSGDPLSLIHI